MQELINRAKELLADGTVARVLGWKAGDLPYNPEPAYFETEESLKDFVYNGFCGANLSKYMIEASKLEGKTLVCLKPCDTYSFNQLIKEHRVDREKAYIIGHLHYCCRIKYNRFLLSVYSPTRQRLHPVCVQYHRRFLHYP